MPTTVYISHVIDAPIEKVWSVMRDFNDMPSYHPNIRKSVIEGDRPSDQVGCVGRLTLAEGYVRERLLCLDDRNYVFTYEIIEGTLPVRGYVAGVTCIASLSATELLGNGGPTSMSSALIATR